MFINQKKPKPTEVKLKCYNKDCAENHDNECEEYFEGNKSCEDRVVNPNKKW